MQINGPSLTTAIFTHLREPLLRMYSLMLIFCVLFRPSRHRTTGLYVYLGRYVLKYVGSWFTSTARSHRPLEASNAALRLGWLGPSMMVRFIITNTASGHVSVSLFGCYAMNDCITTSRACVVAVAVQLV